MVRRYPLPRGRELRVAVSDQRVWLAIHSAEAEGRCTSGPLAIGQGEVDALKSALGDLQTEAGVAEASDLEGRR